MPFGHFAPESLKSGTRRPRACLKLRKQYLRHGEIRLSVRFTARFGAPAFAGIALGHGLQVWTISAAVAGALVAAVLILHAPEALGSLRRLVRRR